MKQTFLPFFAGLAGALVAMTLMSKSFATNHSTETNPATAITNMNEALTSGQCRVDIGQGKLTAGSRCFRGEVMTGLMGETILCSSVNVTCY